MHLSFDGNWFSFFFLLLHETYFKQLLFFNIVIEADGQGKQFHATKNVREVEINDPNDIFIAWPTQEQRMDVAEWMRNSFNGRYRKLRGERLTERVRVAPPLQRNVSNQMDDGEMEKHRFRFKCFNKISIFWLNIRNLSQYKVVIHSFHFRILPPIGPSMTATLSTTHKLSISALFSDLPQQKEIEKCENVKNSRSNGPRANQKKVK